MDIRLREIAGKAAGTYFMVTDNSAVPEIEQTSNLRLFFINTEKGPINTIVVFKKGDSMSFQSVFGKTLRKNEKQGNFSIRECLNALTTSAIAVINIRVFDNEKDITTISGMSPNLSIQANKSIPYSNLFNTNGLWTIKPKNIIKDFPEENLLNFGNVGISDVSFFTTVAKDVSTLTSEGNKSLLNTDLVIEDFPALSPDTFVKDTFVDVWIFDNAFDVLTVSTNRYYGHLFNPNGLIKYSDLEALAAIPEAGFNRKITGSMIPNLKNEFDEIVSIDTLINNVFAETGLICSINDDLLELDEISGYPIINNLYSGYYEKTGALTDNGILLSHRLQILPTNNVDLSIEFTNPPIFLENNMLTFNSFFPDVNRKNIVLGVFESGIRVGDRIFDNGLPVIGNPLYVTKIQSVVDFYDENQDLDMVDFDSYIDQNSIVNLTWVILHLSDVLTVENYGKINDQTRTGYVTPTKLLSYKVRTDQFTDGTAVRQKEILDMIVSPGIVKGLKNFSGIRYIVDCFKSFVEGGYKYQFGQLCKTLDDSNKFVRAFVNEPFIEDLEKSINPLFKESPTGIFDLNYLVEGGNPNYSTNFLTKFNSGSEMCFFFGSKLDTNNNEYPTAADVSNLFVQKTFDWDVVANASGYLDTVSGLALNPDDNERLVMEKFRWNPIIKMPKGFTIYGNSTGQKTRTALAQIHNSELLAYIKESLYNMSRGEAFKKGTYNEYLATEVEVKSFMDSLALSGAIKPNPIVICNASNNTTEISKQKIKLIHIEYWNIDSLDKVVFDLNLN